MEEANSNQLFKEMSEEANEHGGKVDDDKLLGTDNNTVDSAGLVDEGIVGVDGVIVPEVGMKFNDENELFQFYKTYAYDVGFPIRKRNSQKDDNGIVRYVVLTCSREGRRINNTSGTSKPHATIQTGCKARITASVVGDGIWRINTVNLIHNHKTSPSKSRLYRCNRELSDHVKRRLEVNDMAGIPLHKSYNSAVVEAGGYENMTFIEKDCRNYVEQVRRLRLGEGDAAAIQLYFSNMQVSCPGFFFSIDLDEESRLKNIFWADNRSRQAYTEFGDVITFDTTYLTNKYDMPFAPFVGVNHHGQSTLLGCGLLSNENTETFVWLFKTWLQCMRGQAPLGIITDQDKAMQNAIEIVFPNTKHRWCLWHILKKLPEKFGYHDDKGQIFHALHILVYDINTVEEFEEGWKAMIDTYQLHDNDWLSGLYANRGRWVPCYLKCSFWAGMSTTQRSESMNAFFDGYVHSKTSLKQFVEQYERALRNKVEKEFQADFKSYSQMVPCATKYDLEKQFQEVYTISKFKEFQTEFIGKVYCDLISSSEGLFETTYEVMEDVILDNRVKKQKFVVTFKADECRIVCSCHMFEFRGIICRHAIVVLLRNNVTSLPETYVLRRWKRDLPRAHTRVAVNYAGLSSSPAQMRYDKLCQSFASLANITADDDGETLALLEWIERKKEILGTSRSTTGSNMMSLQGVRTASADGASQRDASGTIRDPKCSKRKGAPRKLRKKSPLESNCRKAKSRPTSTQGRRTKAGPSNLGEVEPIVQTPDQGPYVMQAPVTYSQLLLGGDDDHVRIQQGMSPNFFPLSSTSVMFYDQDGNAMPNYYPDAPPQHGPHC